MERQLTPLYAPIPEPQGRYPLAGGWLRFSDVEEIGVGRRPAAGLPAELLDRLTRARTPICDLDGRHPHIMGILNVTPDSFSDGGRLTDLAAVQAAAHPAADILDIGGESTRPGASEVPAEEEIARTAPVIAALREAGETRPISIDTRKADVARAALAVGADMINDVSGLTFDPRARSVAAQHDVPVCLMHAKGLPEDMQKNPRYGDVLREVYHALERLIAEAESAGISREKIVVDPGIGFGKSLAHNLTLIRHIGVFHGLGCMILLGASRKSFIGEAADAPDPRKRLPGSLATALHAVRQGVQILRVHDMAETKQAIDIALAIEGS